MSTPCCVIFGTGRVAGGFIAPMLRSAGWDVVLVGRDRQVTDAITAAGGVWLSLDTDPDNPAWIDGIRALTIDDAALPDVVTGADLLGTSVGPSALESVGTALAPLLRERLDETLDPINIITFENHRRGPERLAAGLFACDHTIAGAIGRQLGIGGAAVWRAISRREISPSGVRYEADAVDECFVDAASLLKSAAPLDHSVPALTLVRSFDDRMVEKLWLFNAGHAAAAYFGWRAGCVTLGDAMARSDIRTAVKAVVEEAQAAFTAHLAARPASAPIPPRSLTTILDRYANPALSDPVSRVGREPRRKLAPNDRFIGPALACLAAGLRPVALASAAAAGLAYAEPGDQQAADLQRELEILSPEEVLATTSLLDPHEELAQLIGECYRNLPSAEGRQ